MWGWIGLLASLWSVATAGMLIGGAKRVTPVAVASAGDRHQRHSAECQPHTDRRMLMTGQDERDWLVNTGDHTEPLQRRLPDPRESRCSRSFLGAGGYIRDGSSPRSRSGAVLDLDRVTAGFWVWRLLREWDAVQSALLLLRVGERSGP